MLGFSHTYTARCATRQRGGTRSSRRSDRCTGSPRSAARVASASPGVSSSAGRFSTSNRRDQFIDKHAAACPALARPFAGFPLGQRRQHRGAYGAPFVERVRVAEHFRRQPSQRHTRLRQLREHGLRRQQQVSAAPRVSRRQPLDETARRGRGSLLRRRRNGKPNPKAPRFDRHDRAGREFRTHPGKRTKTCLRLLACSDVDQPHDSRMSLTGKHGERAEVLVEGYEDAALLLGTAQDVGVTGILGPVAHVDHIVTGSAQHVARRSPNARINEQFHTIG